MAFYPRLFGLERPRIPVSTYCCMVREFKRGQATRAQIVTAFNLSAGEASAHDDLMASAVSFDRIADMLFVAHAHEMRTRLGITEANLKPRLGVS